MENVELKTENKFKGDSLRIAAQKLLYAVLKHHPQMNADTQLDLYMAYHDVKEAISTDSAQQINDFVLNLMKENPVNFVQYALLVIGEDIFKSNATDFKFSQECNLGEKDKRFRISVKGTIKEIKNK